LITDANKTHLLQPKLPPLACQIMPRYTDVLSSNNIFCKRSFLSRHAW